MKITIINGSPKSGKNTSEIMTEYISSAIAQGNEVGVFTFRTVDTTDEVVMEMKHSDVLVFCFPLYVDSIPAHLLRFLVQLEKKGFTSQNVRVYCIVNNGFFEGRQNHIAVAQMKLWCESVHLIWGQAIGCGAGEMIPFVRDIPLGHGPNKNLGHAIVDMSTHIVNQSSGEDIYVSPNWPYFMWRLQAVCLVWYPRAKKNGVHLRELYRYIHSDDRDITFFHHSRI